MSVMDIDQYQTKLIELWGTTPEDHLLFCAVGMAEEAGQAIGKVKRLMRGDGFDREGYLIELGDVLAYLTMAAHEKGWKLENLRNSQEFVLPTGTEVIGCTFGLIRETTDFFETYYLSASEFLLDAITTVLLQIVYCIDIVGSTLEEVMQMNIDKLTNRNTRNVLRGLGDKR